MRLINFIFLIILLASCSSDENNIIDNSTNNIPMEDTLYFPPISGSEWETVSISSLDWNESELQPLLDYLEEKNTKGFIVLHNGKMVIENYFNSHDSNTNWYWASAGKTLTTTIAGIAQDEGLIAINNKVSTYLGTAWTSASLEKEDLITCKNLLSMNSGLDDTLGDSVAPENLQYLADAGNRWAYHNVYVKIQDIVAQASNQNWTNYFNSKLRDPIGMNGTWLPVGDLSVYWSNTRSMARFGLMISAKGKWDEQQVVSESFLNEATNSSQNINQAYGYLWWLNGKSSFHLPQSQIEFPGKLIRNAPNDMYCALGKNDQKIYIVPSKNLVIVRMGNAADDESFGLSTFDNDLWEKINAMID